ncbi:hypothetical protein SAMN05660443_1868 [Marinospirillum celere]|uniref:Secreted protein n=1 Tax=Marinospirillum celere TaxID=1122252 RepID=A0A1I1H8A6_9GAMM|nr:hypothetical protein SAMN05660443_1868 [Marinospirillum celere]
MLLVLLLLSWFPSVHSMAMPASQPTEITSEAPCSETHQMHSSHQLSDMSDGECLGNLCIQCSNCSGVLTSLPTLNLRAAESPLIFSRPFSQGLGTRIERPPKHLFEA